MYGVADGHDSDFKDDLLGLIRLEKVVDDEGEPPLAIVFGVERPERSDGRGLASVAVSSA